MSIKCSCVCVCVRVSVRKHILNSSGFYDNTENVKMKMTRNHKTTMTANASKVSQASGDNTPLHTPTVLQCFPAETEMRTG